MKPVQLAQDLFRFEDTCNVYLARRGDRALAVDFGSGKWTAELPKLGVAKLDHVLLTHHHADQCVGLLDADRRGVRVHAAPGEAAFLRPADVRRFWRTRHGGGCPASYSVLPRGVPGVHYDIGEAADLFWQDLRVRFVPTPGHGPAALSVILNLDGKQIVFCGDSAHAGATLWQPFNLEWDHWTGAGALAAWQGLSRLRGVGMDTLCPSHGPVVTDRPMAMVSRLMGKVMRFYESKLSICPGVRDDYWPSEPFGRMGRRILPHLYAYKGNGYILVSESGESLVVDPTLPQMDAFHAVWDRLGRPKPTAMIASHYHRDHVDAMPLLRKRYGAKACLHPAVAEPLADVGRYDMPWLPSEDIRADELLPENGEWRWNEYVFRVAHFPGQTWWHAAYMTTVDGVKVFFGGDSFQPNTRWNGTGGYCAYNGSRFTDGFMPSAELVLDWAPDLFCNGHGTYFRYQPAQFRKIRQWAIRTERAIADLCPSGNLAKDYDLHHPGKPKPQPSRT